MTRKNLNWEDIRSKMRSMFFDNPGRHFSSVDWMNFYEGYDRDYKLQSIRSKHYAQISIIREELREERNFAGYIISGPPLKKHLGNLGDTRELEIQDGDNKQKKHTLDGYMYLKTISNSDTIIDFITFHKKRHEKSFKIFSMYEKILKNNESIRNSGEYDISKM